MGDYIEECISDLDSQGRDYAAFDLTFCVRCRNADCVRAKRSTDTFSRRVLTQEERLFNPQEVADNQQPQYAQLPDFVDVSEVATKYQVTTTPVDQQAEVKTETWQDRYLGPQDEPLEKEPPVQEFQLPEPPQPVGPKQHSPLIVKPGNAPKQAGGIMLPGPPTSPSKPIIKPVDPWAIPTPTSPNVVGRGATIKLGDK